MRTARFATASLTHQLRTVAIVASTLLVAAAAAAQQAAPEVMVKLRELYPATNFKSVTQTTVPGVYEVVMGKNVVYVEETGRYFFFGNLFDMREQRDLTAPRTAQVNAVDIGALPINDAIKLVKGRGTRTMYVFSDPDCPYCRQLEKTLATMDDVTIYTFLFPINSLHPDATRKAVNVWCSSDRVRAWAGLMLNNVTPLDANCQNPVARNVELASSLGINGTPTIISGDGRKQPGALSEAALSAFLAGPTTIAAGSK